MKKHGFTLAEILIALAIVGVVAAVSIPTMVTENKKKIWANSLSSAVSDFENAMTTYLMTEGNATLIDTKAWKEDGYKGNIGNEKAIGGRFKLEKENMSVMQFYGLNQPLRSLNPSQTATVINYLGIMNNVEIYRAKNGAVYIVKQEEGEIKEDAISNGGRLEQKAAIVWIDVNGKKGPNRVGRDAFGYILGADGYLFPFGSKDVNFYSGIDEVNEKNCSTSVTGTVGEHCAARLARNGYKMDY